MGQQSRTQLQPGDRLKGGAALSTGEDESARKPFPRLPAGRQLLTCPECGWVHYAMTAEEKLAYDQLAQRYQMTTMERLLLESAYRQCLRCESPASDFRVARDADVARAKGHLVTPVFIDDARLHPD
jgi:hypothetical protein